MEDDSTRTYIALSAGTLVSHYKIIRKIGAGGMGEVYLAEDTKLHRQAALKLLPANCCQDEEFRRRFIREAEAAAKLNHPNIVTIYEVDEFRGRPFFAMEHVEGQSLRELIKSGPVDIERVVQLAIQVLDGLNAAHEKGVIHRDIKPSNILIDTYGRPKIVDFGLAAITGGEQLTKSHSTMGTIQYMSPEQIQGGKVRATSDLFSFGIVLYQMLTGELPFTGEYEAAVVYAITSEEPPTIRSLRPSVVPDIETLVFKLLEKDAELRYQTASGVIADLKRISQAAGMKTPSARIAAARRRRKYLLPTSVAAIVIIAVLVLTTWKFGLMSSQNAMAGENLLAIMYFENMADPADTGKLGEIITALLITDLSESQRVKVMSSQRLWDILKQVGREGQKTIDRDAAFEVARKAHCRSMITGAILQTEPTLLVTSHLVDVSSGLTVASQRVEGRVGMAVHDFVDLLTAEVRKDLDIPVGVAGERDRPVAELTTSSEEAYRYYMEGLEFQNKHELTEARGHFLRAVELDSTFAMALCRLGWLSEGNEGLKALEAAMKLRDKATEKERLHILARYHLSRYDFGTAEGVLRRFVKSYPDEKEAWYDLGVVYAQRGHMDSGIICLEQVIQLDPFWEEPFNRLAYWYDRQGQYESSIQAIDKNIQLAPGDPNPYDTKGELLALQGQLDEAKQAFARALEISPDFGYSIDRLGEIFALERKYDSAEIYFQRKVTSEYDYHRSRGRSYMCTELALQGRVRQALDRFYEAELDDVADGVGPWDKRLWQAVLYSGITGDADSIVARWNGVFDLSNELMPGRWMPTYQYPHLWAILSLVEAGAPDDAEDMLKTWEARDGFTSDHTHIAAQAAVEYARGNFQMAANLFDSSLSFVELRRTWTYFQYSYWLGRTLFEFEKHDRAIEIMSELANMYSYGKLALPLETVKLHYYLGRAYEADGQPEKAIPQYEEFLLYWENADPELRLLGDAKERVARLKQTI
ncbi:MAG: protein kinase [Candidatus Zixiibacteriota bacterium]|nr:MAG: protein kinase [candidate division Zixibacteria bacterium]